MRRIIRPRIGPHKFLSIHVLQIYPFAYILARMDKDIATLLKEIKSTTDWSEPRIAAELGTSQPTVNRILNGQPDCKGATLRAIVDLHARVCAPYGPPSRRVTDSNPESDVAAQQGASPGSPSS
jgi:hypothetical protein